MKGILVTVFSLMVSSAPDRSQPFPINFSLPPMIDHAKEQYTISRKKYGKVIAQSPPTYYCKDPRFTLEGHKCVRITAEQVILVCHPGYVKALDGRQCIRKTPIIKACREGYHSRGDHCEKMITIPIDFICPEGTHRTGAATCEKEVPVPLTHECEKGVLKNGLCVFKNYIQAIAHCPEGFDFTNHACVKEYSYDCTGPAKQPQLGPTLSVAQVPIFYPKRGLFEHQTSKSDVPNSRELSECVHDAKTGICKLPHELPHMEKTEITIQKTCTKVTTSSLEYHCPEGIIQGTQCCVEQHMPSVPMCREEGSPQHCFKRVLVPAIPVCPPGYAKECSAPGLATFGITSSISPQCKCVTLETSQYSKSCPPGYVEDREFCLLRAALISLCTEGYYLEDSACIKKQKIDADCVFSVQYECDRERHECD